MSKIGTVLWDTGGVLLTNGWDHNERKTVFDQLGFADREEFERRHEVENDAWEKGAIDFEQYLERTMFFKPQPFTVAAMRAAVEAQSVLLENTAMPVLEELHGKGGLRMGQLNNESRELNELRVEKFGLRQFLSAFFCSGYLGLRKPDPAIFRLAVEVLQTPAAKIVFIDDREKNVAAANAAGMHGVHYTGPQALRAELKTLGLL